MHRRIALILTLAMGCDLSVEPNAICDGILQPAEDRVDAPFDLDGDGYVDGDNPGCVEVYAADQLDCDDDAADAFPGATEICNGVDDNCDGEVDETAVTWYADGDEDGYGDPDETTEACDAPEGFVDNAEDCDDNDRRVNPDGTERCDGVDEDCDGDIDEGATTRYYDDDDGDGYGDPQDRVDACEAPAGTVENREDCDDTRDWINPDAEELCDGLDNDCSSGTPETGMVSAVIEGFYYDVTDQLAGSGPDNILDLTLNSEIQALWFCEGTWTMHMEIVADAEILGITDDPAKVVLSGADAGVVLSSDTEGVNLTLRDLTITEGSTLAEDPSLGGGLFLEDSGSFVGERLRFVDNASHQGAGALILTVGSVTMEEVLFEDNHAGGVSDSGGAGLGIANSSATLTDVDFKDNVSGYSAGLLAVSAEIEMTGGSFDGNVCDGDGCGGGATFHDEGHVVLSGVSFIDNVAGVEGGAFRMSGFVTVEGVDVDFSGNSPDDITLYEASYTCGPGCDFSCDAHVGSCTFE